MASFTLVSPQTIIARNASALYGTVVGATNTANYATLVGNNPDAFLNSVYANSVGQTSTATVASVLVTNLGITDGAAAATAQNYIVAQLNAVPYTARGAVVNSILNLFAGLTTDATFGTYATKWNDQIASAETYDQVPGNPAVDWNEFVATIGQTVKTYNLTNGTDNVPASKGVVTFVADQVYTPNGGTRINSLQDEDNLTGTGTSTLNATLGNTGDNGGNVITPKLAGISTVNAAFTGSGVAPTSTNAVFALDFQDVTGVSTVNVSRVSGTANQASVENIQAPLTNMSITNSNSNNTGGVEFSFGAGVLNGLNTGDLKLSNVQVGNVWIGDNNTAIGANGLPTIAGGGQGVVNNSYENLTIESTGANNTVGILTLPMDTGTAGTITITGDKNLTLGFTNAVNNVVNATTESVTYGGGIAGVNGRLASLDASGMTGTASLSINLGAGFFSTGKADTSGVPQGVSVTGSGNNDTFFLGDAIQGGVNPDSLTGGAGQDKLVVYVPGALITTGTTGTPAVTGIEALEVRLAAAGTSTIAVDKLPDVTTILVRNEGATVPAAVVGGVTTPNVGGRVDVFTLTGLNTTQAGTNTVGTDGITIQHSDTNSNAIGQNTINATLATNTAADTYALTIAEGKNTDPRFNVTYNATSAENVVFRDADTESNTVSLVGIAGHTDTITVGKGTTQAEGAGLTNTFINFDSAARGLAGATWDQRGGYRLDVNGQENDFSVTAAAGLNGAIAAANVDGTVSTTGNLTANVRYNTLDNGVAADARIIAQTLNASAENSDVIARFGDVTRANGVSSQSITGGAGNDSFIFDAQGVKNSGYTSGDTVTGGTGLDTLVLDGNTTAAQANGTAGVGGNVSTQKSEWDNTKGIDVLRLAGNQGYANGTSDGLGNTAAQDITLNTTKLTGIIGSSDKNGGYYVEIDNDFVKQTDAGNNLKIISNDGDLSTNQESDLVLNLRPLAQTSNVTFVGANSNVAAGAADAAGRLNASNRVQLEDNSANGSNVLDGGDTVVDVAEAGVAGTTRLSTGNNNVLEVFNSADVSINDLSQTKNFGRIEGTNDLAVAQSLKLVLNDTVMDQLVDAGTAARVAAPGIAANIERLSVVANNNANIAGAVENLNIDASAVSAKFGLDVFVARGAVNNITGSLGNDKVLILGNYNANDATAGGYAAVANDQFAGANLLTGAKIAALTNPTSSASAANIAAGNVGTYWGADNIAGTADDVLLKDTSIYTLGAGDTIEVFGGVDLTGATITAGTNLIAHSTVRLTDAQVNSLASIKFVGGSTHLLEIADDGVTTTTASLLNTGANTNKLTVDAAGGTANLFIATAGATAVTGLSTITTTGGTVNTTTTVGGVATSNFTQGAIFNDTNVTGTNGTAVTVGSNSTAVTTTTGGGTGGTGGTTTTATVAVTAANTSFDASTANNTFNVTIGSTYTYNASGFASGDKIAFPTGTAISVNNTSGTDGVLDVIGSLNGNAVTIHLTGVATASDGAVFGVNSFNTAFGTGSLA